MTGVCGGGTSGPQAGVATNIVVTQQYVQSILPPALAFLYPYLPFMHGLEIGDVPTFCSVDPPTWSLPTGPQFLDFVSNGNFANATLVNNFLIDITRAYLWYSLCKCTVGSPTPITPPTAPTDLPVLNPTGIVSLPLNPNCDNIHNSNATIGPYVAAAFGPVHSGDTGSPAAYIFLPTSQATSYRVTLKNTTLTGTGLSMPFQIKQASTFAGAAPLGATASGTLAAGATTQFIMTATVGPPYLVWLYGPTTGTGTADFSGSMLEAFCGGDTPGGTQNPCCPPDEILSNNVASILNLVTLLQRQLAPFATVHGTAHTGLSGNGQFAVQGLVGLAVDLTTTPSRAGVTSGDPDQIYDVGWVNVGTADGWGPRHFISSDPFLLSPVAGDVTLVGYSIPDDVTLTITELVREP